MRCKKIEKNIRLRKIITHKTVFMWFGDLPTSTELQRFHYRPKPPLHGLSLKKSPIKKLQQHYFKSGHNLDQTQLGSIKPNRFFRERERELDLFGN